MIQESRLYCFQGHLFIVLKLKLYDKIVEISTANQMLFPQMLERNHLLDSLMREKLIVFPEAY